MAAGTTGADDGGLLRVLAYGSVDDGKSSLLGRLLHERWHQLAVHVGPLLLHHRRQQHGRLGLQRPRGAAARSDQAQVAVRELREARVLRR